MPSQNSKTKIKRQKMSDIPKELQHHYVEWNGKPYHRAFVPASVLARIDAGQTTGLKLLGLRTQRTALTSELDYMLEVPKKPKEDTNDA